MSDFLEDWLSKGKKEPSKLVRNTIKMDRWDRRRYEEIAAEERDFMIERQALLEVAPATGSDLWADAFTSFNRVSPELEDIGHIDPRNLINRLVNEQAMELPDHMRLKRFTEGDAVASANACISMRPTYERLYDRTRTAQKQAEELQKKLEELLASQQEQRDLDAMIKEWQEARDPENPDEEQAADYQQQQALIEADVQRLQDELQGLSESLQEEMDKAEGAIKGLLRMGLSKAANDAEQAEALARMWGLEPGHLVRLPADQRLKLAKRINNDRFKRMADLFGSLERYMATEQQRRVIYIPEEVYDISIGKDLERVLPSEFADLMHPTRRMSFYQKFIEGKLLQYEMRGTDSVARGGIVCCLDNSGSMGGDNELWGKAIALCLLHLSRIQKRNFYGIHFGSFSEIKQFDFGIEEEYSVEKVLDFAEFFFGGGTNFQRPMSLALDRVAAEFNANGAVQADIVFITDGACGVPETWKKAFLAEMVRIDATMWGLVIGGNQKSQPLYDLCRGRVGTIHDILDSTKDLTQMFRGI